MTDRETHRAVQRPPTEQRNPLSAWLDDMDATEIAQVMIEDSEHVANTLLPFLSELAATIDLAANALADSGRLIYIGAGTSGRLGVLDASECPPTFGSDPSRIVGIVAGGPRALVGPSGVSEDDEGAGRSALEEIDVRSSDVVVGIAASGSTPFVLSAMKVARTNGASVIGLCCNPNAPMAGLVDVFISPDVGPEILTGSSRLKAGTITKLALNIISTGAMARIGKTYGNLMVDMTARNTKLRSRASQMVSWAAHTDLGNAGRLLNQANDEVSTAIVSSVLGCDAVSARHQLAAHHGRVRGAIAGSKGRALPIFMGVDGGGSNTDVSLVDERGVVLGSAQGGPSNLVLESAAVGLENVRRTIEAAFDVAGIQIGPVEGALVGVAGCGNATRARQVKRFFEEYRLAQRTEVASDISALADAYGSDEDMVVLVAGTGSIALSCPVDGPRQRVGGWGTSFGDEGSATWLAIEATRRVLWALDGRGESTLLLAALCERLDSNQAGLEKAVRDLPDRRSLASLATAVFECAGLDAVANSIVQEGARHLALMANAAFKKVGDDCAHILVGGGLLTQSSAYRDLVRAGLATGGISLQMKVASSPAEAMARQASASAPRQAIERSPR